MMPHCDVPGDPVIQHSDSASRQSRPEGAGLEQIAQRELPVKQIRTGSTVLADMTLRCRKCGGPATAGEVPWDKGRGQCLGLRQTADIAVRKTGLLTAGRNRGTERTPCANR